MAERNEQPGVSVGLSKPKRNHPHRLWSDQLAADLAVLEHDYREHQQQFPSEWLDYGEIDPSEPDPRLLFAPVDPACRPNLTYRQARHGARVLHEHLILYPGGELGPFRERWQAMLAWNQSPLSAKPAWREFPFFFLATLEPQEAREKLGALRGHLEMRARLLKLRAMSGERVGRGFLNRIKAYLGWCELAQILLKEQVKTENLDQ